MILKTKKFRTNLLILLMAVLNVNAIVVQGLVEPYRSAEISPQVSGRVIKIGVEEGSVASKGDTLIAIEHSEALLQVERTRLIAKNDADVRAARLKIATLKLEYEATKFVFDSTNAVSEEELWNKKYQYDAAQAEYDQLVVQKSREAIEHKIASAQLDRHLILAPYRCIVSNIDTRKWEHCQAGEPLVSIVDSRRCRFVAYIPISDIGDLSEGDKVSMLLDTPKGQVSRSGTIDFISPVVDPSSGLLTVKVVFNNSDRSIRPGVSGVLMVNE